MFTYPGSPTVSSILVLSLYITDIIRLKNTNVFQVQGTVLGVGIAIEYVFIEWIISHHFTL